MSLTPIIAVILGSTTSFLLLCVMLVVLLKSRSNAGRNQIKMTVYPVGKDDSSTGLHAMENKVMTEFDSTEERSPDLIPDGKNTIPTWLLYFLKS